MGVQQQVELGVLLVLVICSGSKQQEHERVKWRCGRDEMSSWMEAKQRAKGIRSRRDGGGCTDLGCLSMAATSEVVLGRRRRASQSLVVDGLAEDEQIKGGAPMDLRPAAGPPWRFGAGETSAGELQRERSR